jgi:hypothetical protein
VRRIVASCRHRHPRTTLHYHYRRISYPHNTTPSQLSCRLLLLLAGPRTFTFPSCSSSWIFSPLFQLFYCTVTMGRAKKFLFLGSFLAHFSIFTSLVKFLYGSCLRVFLFLGGGRWFGKKWSNYITLQSVLLTLGSFCLSGTSCVLMWSYLETLCDSLLDECRWGGDQRWSAKPVAKVCVNSTSCCAILFIIIYFLNTGFFLTLALFSGWWYPPSSIKIQVCSPFLMTCDVRSLAVFVVLLLNVLVLFPHF